MRHQQKTLVLGRPKKQREALLRSLADSFVLHGAITTTKVKAKAARSLVEKLITKAKKNTPRNREAISAALYTGKAVKKLIDDIAPRYKERVGGYTRMVKLGYRKGDSGEKVRIEFV